MCICDTSCKPIHLHVHTVQALLKRSSHYWEILVDILTDRDSYRDTPKYRKPQPRLPRGSDRASPTPQKTSLPVEDQEKVVLLNQARMALGDAAAYRGDVNRAVSLYSRVKTARAAWNQAQVRRLIMCMHLADMWTCLVYSFT